MRRLAPALLAWLIFFWIGHEVVGHQTRVLDDQARVLVQTIASDLFTSAMRGFTLLGIAPVLLPLTAIAVVLFYRRGLVGQAWTMGLSAAGGKMLEQIFKYIYHRARPEPFFHTPLPSSYSFPSGHALMSGTIFLTLAWLLAAQQTRRPVRIAIWIAGILLVWWIGASRIYLGVHYASDVLGGYCLALAWVFTVRAFYARHL